ncbi:hypothetical protein AGMMS49992_21150 [Clostridia bacterium]|nr:hypothetical protein AGMMS49992_21150 [Clostridia bacterium]
MIILFNTLSVFYIIKWWGSGDKSHYIAAHVFVVISALFHAGSLFLSIGYFIIYLLFETDRNGVVLGKKHYIT